MWLLFSQLSALAETASNVLAKKSLAEYDSIVLTWFWVTTSQAVLLAVVLWQGLPIIQPAFYAILAARIVLDTIALLLFTKALQLADVSLVTPLFNFSAIFSLLFSAIFNKELPSAWGIAGVLLIVAGAYWLHFDTKNFWQPVVSIFKNRASKYMLVSTVLYGLIFSISKLGIEASSVSFYTFAAALGLSISIFPIAYFKNKADLRRILQPRNAVKVLPLGLIDSLKILTLMATINSTYVGFADAANNTSLLYNQAAAKIFLGEKISSRIMPTVLMFVGLVCVVVLG